MGIAQFLTHLVLRPPTYTLSGYLGPVEHDAMQTTLFHAYKCQRWLVSERQSIYHAKEARNQL
jgi:hypothetical protein